jgi:hypothetical protein
VKYTTLCNNVGIGTGRGSGEFLAKWMTMGRPPSELATEHADRIGNDMTKEVALEAIRGVYAIGKELPGSI